MKIRFHNEKAHNTPNAKVDVVQPVNVIVGTNERCSDLRTKNPVISRQHQLEAINETQHRSLRR